MWLLQGNSSLLNLVSVVSHSMSFFRYLLFLTPVISVNETFGQRWELEKKEDGISIYTTKKADDRVKTFKGLMTTNTSLHELVGIFKDVSNAKKWIYKCAESRVEKVENFWHQYNYYEIEAWPFENRDMVMDLRMSQNAETKTIRITIKNASELILEMKGKTRVEVLEGYWQFKPESERQVEITYQLTIDPGKGIPPFLANTRAVKDPFETLKELRRIIRSRKYKTSHYPQLKP